MTLEAYFKDHQINYNPPPLARLLERISYPPNYIRKFQEERHIGENTQISLATYTVNGIRFKYKVFNPPGKSLEEKLNNPEIETLQIKNYFGRKNRGAEIRIRRVRNDETIVVRYKARGCKTTKTFKTNTPTAIQELERYIQELIPQMPIED